MKIIKKNLAKKTIVMTEPMRWEAELLEVYETAASTDDRSDIECVISYVRDLLAKERQQVIAECLEAVKWKVACGTIENFYSIPKQRKKLVYNKEHIDKVLASLRLKGKI